jgi:hypothetical protein
MNEQNKFNLHLPTHIYEIKNYSKLDVLGLLLMPSTKDMNEDDFYGQFAQWSLYLKELSKAREKPHKYKYTLEKELIILYLQDVLKQRSLSRKDFESLKEDLVAAYHSAKWPTNLIELKKEMTRLKMKEVLHG